MTFDLYGLSETELNARYQNHLTNNIKTPITDFVWSLFQKILISSAGKAKTEYDLYESQWRIYASMLDFRRKFEKSKANEILQLHLKAYIQMSDCQSNSNLKCKVISGSCCEFCDSLNGVNLEINDALKNQYLASTKCTNEKGCNCCYSLVPERDSNGRLILNSK